MNTSAFIRTRIPSLIAVWLLSLGASKAQQSGTASPAAHRDADNTCHAGPSTSIPVASANSAPTDASGPANAPKPGLICINLQDALDRARKNSPQFQIVVTDAAIARQDSKQSIAALLPSITYNNSFIYTQPGGVNGIRFIANNSVHEYVSQGNAHESIGIAEIAGYLKTRTASAIAAAKSEIASRGLVVTVVQLYYGLASAQEKAIAARELAEQGDQFLQLTKQLEAGGEVAHSDTIKAELQASDRKRQLKEAELAVLNARLDLAVVLFPNFNLDFAISDDLHAPVAMPREQEVEQQASKDNPDIRAALLGERASEYDMTSARTGYLPSLSLDYFYGIDAPNFATHYRGFTNLGYSAVATLNIPIWNWGATQSRVKQAELRREQSQRELSFEQRKLVAEIRSSYQEAATAADEQAGLERAVKLASESLRLTTLRYKNSEGTVLEVVDAQSAMAAASSAFHDGAARYRIALANLQTLTGVLATP